MNPLPPSRTADGDFWIPQATPTGQVFYVNTETGKHSLELPTEVDEDSLSDLAALSHTQVLSKSRSGSIAALGLASTDVEGQPQTTSESPLAESTNRAWLASPTFTSPMFASPLNPLFTRKSPSSNLPCQDVSLARGACPATSLCSPSPSEYSPIVTRPPSSSYRHALVSPTSPERSSPLSSHAASKRPTTSAGYAGPSSPPAVVRSPRLSMDLTSAERLAQTLQRTLAPSPPQTVNQMLEEACKAIRDVLLNIKSRSHIVHSEHFESDVVTAVRDLLCVAGALAGHIPSAVTPRSALPDHPYKASQALLKGAQQKLTTALFKFGISAQVLQLQWDPSTVTPAALASLSESAELLDVELVSFAHVLQQEDDGAPMRVKRLRGAFLAENIGVGMVGAGAAGSWKGFGWVYLSDNVEPPKNVLCSEALNELVVSLEQVESRIIALEVALAHAGRDSADFVRIAAHAATASISTHLEGVNELHVGGHVDLDGLHQDAMRPAIEGIYTQTVEQARDLNRLLEASVQAIYDDASSLFLVAQRIAPWSINHSSEERKAAYENLAELGVSIRKNATLVQQTLDALLGIGSRQATMARGNYRGSIRWRMVRTSLLGEHFSIAGSPTLGNSEASQSQTTMVSGNTRSTLDVDLSFRHPSASDSTDDTSELEFNPMLYGRHNSSRTILAVTGKSPSRQDSFEEERGPKIERKQSSDKLRRVLGDEPPWIVLEAFDTKPWYLRPNRDPSEIIIDPDGSVRGGTVSALVERLTAHEHGDPRFIQSFLMTFKTFTSVTELFRLLVERYNITPPAQLEPPQLEDWRRNKQYVIQTRVLNTLKTIVVDENVLEEADLHIVGHIRNFVGSEEVIQHVAAKSIKILIERMRRDVGPKLLITTGQLRPPRPIYPKPSAKLQLLDIDMLEMARQLTILESALYSKIKPFECLQRTRGAKAENITAVVETSNRIADWTASTILSSTDPRRRAGLIKHFIGVAYRCRTMNNFSSMMAILSGLNLPSIRRLQITWGHVNTKYMGQLACCEWIIDPTKNFGNYQSTLSDVNPPCVPFIGRFLSTLQAIQEGNPDDLPGGLVNFRKRVKAGEVVQTLLRWQSQPHNFQMLPVVHDFIQENMRLMGTSSTNRERFWNVSLELERRERHEETMLKLLDQIGVS